MSVSHLQRRARIAVALAGRHHLDGLEIRLEGRAVIPDRFPEMGVRRPSSSPPPLPQRPDRLINLASGLFLRQPLLQHHFSASSCLLAGVMSQFGGLEKSAVKEAFFGGLTAGVAPIADRAEVDLAVEYN